MSMLNLGDDPVHHAVADRGAASALATSRRKASRAQASEREKAIATGCEELDVKPIAFESLLATIRRIVANPK